MNRHNKLITLIIYCMFLKKVITMAEIPAKQLQLADQNVSMFTAQNQEGFLRRFEIGKSQKNLGLV